MESLESLMPRGIFRILKHVLCGYRTCQEPETGAGIKEQGPERRGLADPGTAGAEDLRGDGFAEGTEQREEKCQGGLSV